MTDPTIHERNAFVLARAADVPSPDSRTSPGAAFLVDVASSLTDYLADDRGDLADDVTTVVGEVVEAWESRGTYRVWLAFADLAAWSEDLSDYGPVEDMTSGAHRALAIIGERLAYSLLEATGDEDEDEDNACPDDPDGQHHVGCGCEDVDQ